MRRFTMFCVMPRFCTCLLILASPIVACGDDGSADAEGSGSAATADTTADSVLPTTTDPMIECEPGLLRCADAVSLERCAPTGKLWINEPCASMTLCTPCEDESCTEDRCLGPCDSADELPSSAGCSFIANRQLHMVEEFNDGLVVANPNSNVQATVQLYLTPEGKSTEEPVGDAVVLDPLEAHTFELTTNFVQGYSSMFRTGGTHRIQSDVPVIAYHHAPVRMSLGNDSSLLLPESALRNEYIAFSYGVNSYPRNGEPTYFEVVALQNFTTLEWFPPVATAGNGLPVPFVPAGGRGELKMNRFDTVRIAASGNQTDIVSMRDVSGTVIKANKPIWVTSGSRCSRVPTRDVDVYPLGHCDPLQEMPIPLEYWGTTYVAAASPDRDDERHWWRVYAGKDGTEVTTEPVQAGTPFILEKRGDYMDLSVANGTSFVFQSDNGVFMPVQYLQSKRFDEYAPTAPGIIEPAEESTQIGDPAMYQMVPVEQFLSRYVFATALNFPNNYVQVIRTAAGPDVVLDGAAIDSVLYLPVGSGFEIADVLIEEGAHLIESDAPFGIVQVGYSGPGIDEKCELTEEYLDPMTGLPDQPCYSSYAYPGGMKSEPIYVP